MRPQRQPAWCCNFGPDRLSGGRILREIEAASIENPSAIIVVAIEESGRGRGVLLHHGENRIDYLKLGTDGRTSGTDNVQQNPVYETGNLCVGVLICMDIQHRAFSWAVIERVRSSECELKLVCVPADMTRTGTLEDHNSRASI